MLEFVHSYDQLAGAPSIIRADEKKVGRDSPPHMLSSILNKKRLYEPYIARHFIGFTPFLATLF